MFSINDERIEFSIELVVNKHVLCCAFKDTTSLTQRATISA